MLARYPYLILIYSLSFPDLEDILNMRINRFHHLNVSGQLAPLDDSIKTEMYARCISMIGVDFQLAHSMTEPLMAYLLLNTGHWRQRLTNQLSDLALIRDQHHKAKAELRKAWYKINEDQLPNLDKLVKILKEMNRLQETSSEHLEVIPSRKGLFNEETKWVQDAVETFHNNMFSWPKESESWMIAEEKAIANGNFTDLPAYLGYCNQALQEKAQQLLSICTEEGSPRLQLDFGNFQMLSMGGYFQPLHRRSWTSTCQNTYHSYWQNPEVPRSIQ